MTKVHGKVALVTGGASGIGYQFVEALLKNDLKAMTIVDIDDKQGQEALKKIEKKFGAGKAIFVKTDVTSDAQFEAAFKKTIETFKHLDIVINNAGILCDVQWEKTIAINLGAVVRGTYLAVEKYLPKHKSGHEGIVVNTASVLGLQPLQSVPVYTASKHGVIGLSRSYGTSAHYERTKVKVLSICPGVTTTPLLEGSQDGKLLGPFDELFPKDMATLPPQSPDCLGPALIKVINEGTNGSVWVIEGGEPAYEAIIPDRLTFRKK